MCLSLPQTPFFLATKKVITILTWDSQSRNLVCYASLPPTFLSWLTILVLSKGAAEARASGRDRAPASVSGRVFLASIAFPQDDPKGAGLVRGGDVSRLFVREICLWETTSRR